MTPETFAEWLRRQGHRVIRTRSSYWFDSGPRVFQAFPYHWIIEPTEEELRDIFFEENAIGLRYSTPLEAEEGSCSYHVVFEGPSYGIKNVDSSIRAKVRKGLEACQVGPISLHRYAHEGWPLELDTQARQGRNSRHGKTHWRRMLEATEGLEGFEAWGSVVEGRLAAGLMFARIDGCIDLLYQQSLSEFLNLRVNNALIFETTRCLVERPGIQMIHNGLHSLDAPATVDQFKVRLGYTVKPVKQRVVFHPRIVPLIGDGISRLSERLGILFPRNDYIQKTEGLLRFYCNGKLPLGRQPFPELLESERDSICRQAGQAGFQEHQLAPPDRRNVRISPATPKDLEAILALHRECPPGFDHPLNGLGMGFFASAYRWFINSPGCLVLVVRLDRQIVGFTLVSERPYRLPLLKACRWALLAALLRRPWLLASRRLLSWLRSDGFPAEPGINGRQAQLAFTAVAPAWRRRGLGSLLHKAAFAACRERGVSSVTILLGQDAAEATAFTRSTGLTPVAGSPSVHRLGLETPSRAGIGD